MSVPEPLTVDDANTLDAMFARSNAANIIDLLATKIFGRAAAARAVNLYDPSAIELEAQATILRHTQKTLEDILDGQTDPESAF